ncbi:Gmad2 immunoglobulin-like domain-containing protein [Nocardioides abyssi]|uniref:Gmad2 immunoglobulin-like domain-containing protein n=1 Tax=Nocardioides abyssi TaxID=3058370 RepID=A0ABT8EXK8_9ACTN|nr:Gmad2 immunoglobulin-like domain-containing protein [Nocardioides abyssi]MDN4162872.1 Gmad2 immunoglobulin-like domain-containing protein [Nocardioides abyssi]
MDARLRISALLTASTLALTLAACGEDDTSADDPAPAGSTSSPTASSTPSDEPSASDPTATSEPSQGGGETTVPVYFAGDTPQGVRLYREFRRVGGDHFSAAAALTAYGDAVDPDYRSLWPENPGGIVGVEPQDDAIVVTVDGAAWSERGDLTAAEARIAAQQLVYTLQGVAQERLPVRVVDVDGAPVPLFGTEGDLTQAAPLEVLALVSISGPEQGETVADTFTAAGVASSFEATVPWEVRDEGGKVVLDGFATAEGWMDKLYPWASEVDVSGLEPGTYSFVAMTDDPSGGEGFGPTEDSKTITVE